MSLDDVLDSLPAEMIKHLSSLKSKGKVDADEDSLTNDEEER